MAAFPHRWVAQTRRAHTHTISFLHIFVSRLKLVIGKGNVMNKKKMEINGMAGIATSTLAHHHQIIYGV